MKIYHKNWLKAHPERSAEWLSAVLAEGFAIHHVDGNPENNDPENLVLIEAGDHFKFHNNGMLRPLVQRAGKWTSGDLASKKLKEELSIGERAYSLMKDRPGKRWREIALDVGYKGDVGRAKVKAMMAAKKWAEYHKKKWPIHDKSVHQNLKKARKNK